MNEIGWFVAGIEFVLISLCGIILRGAYKVAVRDAENIQEAARRIERDRFEIEEYLRLRTKDHEQISELKENGVVLYEAAGFSEDAKFMDVARAIKQHKQDSEELATFKERASKVFNMEQGD